MATKSLSKATWLEHLALQERSGATQQAYCKEQGLSLSAFQYWKKRKAREATSGKNSFIEVRVPETSAESTRDICTIEFPNGCSVRVHATSVMRELIEMVAMVNVNDARS